MTIHHFHPTRYENAFGTYPPVLHIVDGDTVVTSTIDAWGFDASGQQVAERPNPLTGPFYIEGAVAGDTLAVQIDHLYPSRGSGFTVTVLAENVVEAEYVRRLPERDVADWKIDLQGGWASMTAPFAGLEKFSLPLNPMLGCLGVAPQGGQAISSATSGRYGGNMDYRGVVSGATLYFPVFVPGALLFLGDGHAVQGAGEVVGTGIETSFEARFTVRLLPGRHINTPRGEDGAYIFTLGNARPLDLALQIATTEMLAWVEEEYGLGVEAASTLLGMCVEYEVGNIYDPAYTVVCKLPKSVMAGLGK